MGEESEVLIRIGGVLDVTGEVIAMWVLVALIAVLSFLATRRMKDGEKSNLLDLLAADPAFGMTLEELEKTMDPARYIGCAPHQVERYLNEVIRPILDANSSLLGVEADIKV